MKKTLVINLTRVAQDVPVRHADQTLDYISIVPRGKVELRDGLTVDTRWRQLNPEAVDVVEPKTDPKEVTNKEGQ